MGVGHLHECDLREVGALPVELRVDREAILFDESVDQPRECSVVLDQLEVDLAGATHGLS
ncbi:MAG: hypothetical protein V9E94_11245 [Microthrixaceae bacterium]